MIYPSGQTTNRERMANCDERNGSQKSVGMNQVSDARVSLTMKGEILMRRIAIDVGCVAITG
jgi:hypothetical protein